MHLCHEEVLAMCAALPWLGFALTWARVRFRRWKKHPTKAIRG